MKPSRKREYLLSRLIFFVVGASFGMSAILALRSGQIPVGRMASGHYVTIGGDPVQYWIYIGVFVIGTIVGFTGAFVKRKRDA
jgi:hypothetical protein